MNKMNIYFQKLTIVCFLLVSTLSFAQGQSQAQKEVVAITDEMFDNMSNKNYDALLDAMYPKVFEIAPKELLKSSVKSMLEGDEELSIVFPKEAPKYKVSDVFKGKENALSYAFVTYDLGIQMVFKGQAFDEDGKKMMKNIMAGQGMEMTFTSGNKADVVTKNQMTIVLKDNTTKNVWTLINFDSESPFFSKMLPEEVAIAAKKYRKEIIAQREKE